MTGYPWASGDELDASDLNDAIGGRAPAVALTNADAALTAANAAQTVANAAMPKVGGTVIATGSTASRTLEGRFSDVINVKDFGAIGDGLSDDTAAIQAAVSAYKRIYVPAGTYLISGTISVPDGAHIAGAGFNAAIITSTSTSLPMLSLTGSTAGITLENFQVTRSVTALSGADGITCSGVTLSLALIRRLLIQNQWNGLSLGATDFSEIANCIVQNNRHIGILITNPPSNGSLQWSCDSVCSQFNGVQGFLIQAAAGPSQVTLGTFKNCATFGNSGVGIGFSGLPSVPIHGVRINGGFFGSDGNDEIFLDTYGGQHAIYGAVTELAGQGPTGPNLTTAQSDIGVGVLATANNTDILLTAVHANGHSQDGFYLSAGSCSLSNCRATNNGLTLTTLSRNGVRILAGTANIVGGEFINTGSSTSQQYGVYVYDGNAATIGFANLANNSTASWGAAANLLNVTSVGNLPNTLNVGLSPGGAVLVGGVSTTGGFTAPGTVNVDGGILKNNTAYTSP